MMVGFQLFNYISVQEQSQTLSYNQFKIKIEQNIIEVPFFSISGSEFVEMFVGIDVCG